MAKKFSFNSLINSVSKFISEDNVKEKSQSPRQKAHEQEIENSILVLAAEIIRCDRNFTDETENFIHHFFNKQFGAAGKKYRSHTLNSHLETGAEPFIKIACQELKILTTYDSRINIVRFLFGVASADDFINTKEERCIHRMAAYLGVSEKDFMLLKHTTVSANNPYFILGVTENVTFEEVKTAYRKMALKFHPDKRKEEVSQEEASRKFREIKHAFEVIKKQQKNF